MDLFSRTYGARTTPITAYRSGRNFVEVKGIQLVDWLRQGPTTDAFVRALNELVFDARVVVFRDQGIVAGADQVEISKWFNPLESTFYKHPMSPHPDVFRVSNDAAMGCTGVGRTGWHVDGSFQPSPFSHALYHIWSCPSQGETAFLGMIAGFKTAEGQVTGLRETNQLLDELEKEIIQSRLIYTHEWKEGDLIITDNCAVAHEAAPSTQLPVEEVGLRVMHRTTTTGWVR